MTFTSKVTTEQIKEKEVTNFIQMASKREPGVLTKKAAPSSNIAACSTGSP